EKRAFSNLANHYTQANDPSTAYICYDRAGDRQGLVELGESILNNPQATPIIDRLLSSSAPVLSSGAALKVLGDIVYQQARKLNKEGETELRLSKYNKAAELYEKALEKQADPDMFKKLSIMYSGGHGKINLGKAKLNLEKAVKYYLSA